jgi:hypothetical protein
MYVPDGKYIVRIPVAFSALWIAVVSSVTPSPFALYGGLFTFITPCTPLTGDQLDTVPLVVKNCPPFPACAGKIVSINGIDQLDTVPFVLRNFPALAPCAGSRLSINTAPQLLTLPLVVKYFPA